MKHSHQVLGRRRLLLLSYHFPPSAEVAGKPTARLVRYLPRYGWDVVVVTIPPEAVYGPIDPVGYADVVSQTRIERVSPGPYLTDAVLRTRALLAGVVGRGPKQVQGSMLAAPAATGRRKSGRLGGVIWRYAKFPDWTTGWVRPAYQRARALLRQESFDAVMSVAPPFSAHLVGMALRRKNPLPWVAQFHDPWANNPFADNDRLLRRASAYLEARVVRSASMVLCATDEATDAYRARYPGLRRRFATLANGYDPADFPPPVSSRAEAERKLRLVYAGTLYQKRDPFPFLQGIAEVVRSGRIAPEEISIEFIGDCEVAGGRRVRDAADELGLASVVTMTPAVPYPVALARMQAADVLLLFAQGQPEQIPAKVYEYLNSGRFILAFTDGATARLIKEVGGGSVVQPGEQPRQAIEEIIRRHRTGELTSAGTDMQKLHRYRADTLAEQLAGSLDGLANRHATTCRMRSHT